MKSTRRSRIANAAILAATLLLWDAAEAAQTPDQKCARKRFDAAANYMACQQKVIGKLSSGAFRGNLDFGAASLNCTIRLDAKWDGFQKALALAGTVCVGDRWVDNGPTVTDLLTGFEWEKKTTDPGSGTNPSDLHDVDNVETWSQTGSEASGTIFTSFIPGLNSAGFAGQSDWRLPGYSELMSILTPDLPKEYPICASPPCIPSVFGPTAMVPPTYIGGYWVATTTFPGAGTASFVDFQGGPRFFTPSYPKTAPQSVRAVRGGW